MAVCYEDLPNEIRALIWKYRTIHRETMCKKAATIIYRNLAKNYNKKVLIELSKNLAEGIAEDAAAAEEEGDDYDVYDTIMFFDAYHREIAEYDMEDGTMTLHSAATEYLSDIRNVIADFDMPDGHDAGDGIHAVELEADIHSARNRFAERGRV
jgi:hypothetical protein